MSEETGGKEFTGRKMLIVTVSAFTVIIGVNIYMAWSAIHTFPGLEVENSYIASQQFDENRAAQEALGWNVAAQIDGAALRLDVFGPDGSPVQPASIDAVVGRSTERGDDREASFERAATGAYYAEIGALDPGYWVLWLKMHAEDGTLFQQRIELFVASE